MRMFWQTEDKAIEKLLRARRITDAACRGFDPDLASAYVERSLTSTEQARYEIHLSECAGCRKTTVALMRSVEADKPDAVRRVEKPGWGDALKGLAVALATPRSAIAATAVIVIAASFAFVVLRQPQTADTEQARANQPEQKAEAQPAQLSSVAPAEDQAPDAQSGRPLLAKAGRAEREQESEDAEEKKDATSEPPAPPTSQPTVKAAEGDAAAKTEEMARKTESEKSDSAPPPPTEDKPLPRIEGARSVPGDGRDDRSRVSTLRPGVVDGEAREGGKEKKVIRPDDAVARGEAASTSGTAGRIASPPTSSRLRDSKDEAKSRPKGTPEIRVGGKKFYFLNNTWTDKDYKPEKEMPVVPVVRGSALYKELLTKNAGLKIYFESERFAEERAIIVYKNTVYKLSPPEK